MSQLIVWSDSIAGGATYVLPQNGTTYELILATGRISIRTSSAKFSGQYNQVPVGIQAQQLAFTKLELKNLENYSVNFQILVSDGNFRNNQVILGSASNPDVTNPTYPTPDIATVLNIPDLTGQKFTDINGNKWLAIYRKAIIISNYDTGVTLRLQKAGATLSTDPSVLICPPALPVQHLSSGSFSISNGGSNVNATVSEIYSSIVSST